MDNHIKIKVDNAKQWPKKYTTPFLEQGLVDYQDSDLGLLLLTKETIDSMKDTFLGKPVIIRHQEVNEENFEDLSVGLISDIFYNEKDGWYYADLWITNDEGHEKIAEGWGTSCAYNVNKISEGGTYHNIPYDGKILDGQGEHIALVKHPRYEKCMEVVMNGKSVGLYNEKNYTNRPEAEKRKQGGNKMFKFKKKEEEVAYKPATKIDLGNGKVVSIKELVEFHNSKEEEENVDGNVLITVANGKKVKLADLIHNYSVENVKTDEGEKEEEEESEEKADRAAKKENSKKMDNCGCGMKNGEHEKDCTMYNESEEDVEKNTKKAENELDIEERLTALENENKKLKTRNEALESVQNGKGTFKKIKEVKNGDHNNSTEVDIALENGEGTLNSNSASDNIEKNRSYFEPSGYKMKKA